MMYKFERFINPRSTSILPFEGITVCKGQIYISIKMANILKNLEIDKVVLFFDREKKAIKIEKTEKSDEGLPVKWQRIPCAIFKEMPEGRYEKRDDGTGNLLFIKV